MRYPIAIELGTPTSAFGVVVPDLPGCFSAGDTLDAASAAVEEAAAAWVDAALDAGEAIPAPSSLDALRENPDFRGWAFGVTTLSPALLDDLSSASTFRSPAVSCAASTPRPAPQDRAAPVSSRIRR